MKKHIIYGLFFLIFTFPSIIFAQSYDVDWTNISLCSVSGNDLTKTGVNSWNGGAASKNVLPPGQDGWAEMTVAVSDKIIYFGLSEYNYNDGSSNINYAFATQANGNLQIYENGGYKAAGGTYAINDKLKIERIGTSIYFKKNDQLIYTSTTPSSTQLLVDAFIYHNNAVIQDAIASFDIPPADTTGYDLVWIDLVNATTDGNSVTATAQNAGAASENTILAGTDGWVEITVAAIDKYFEFGLSDINESHTASSIDYRFQLYLNGALTIYENTTSQGYFGHYYEGDVMRIERIGTTIHYKKNGVTIYTSTTPSSTDLIADVALVTNGSEAANGRASVANTTDPCISLGGDVDGDGICATDDCDDNNPNVPDQPGTVCDDGDTTTINDVLLTDGCTCAGETPASSNLWTITSDNNLVPTDIEGKVGIGTDNFEGDYLLQVKGKIRTQKIKVLMDESEWPDFVFENDYELLPLTEVEQYILQNQHLPNIPSAQIVGQEGLFLGDINAKLLQKVEELTLYIIAQHKAQKVLEEQVQELTGGLKKLKARQH